jgi:hypothetical protein
MAGLDPAICRDTNVGASPAMTRKAGDGEEKKAAEGVHFDDLSMAAHAIAALA